MRVAIISHTYVLRANRGKLEALARFPGIEVLLVAPRTWRNRDVRQRFVAQPQEAGPLLMLQVSAWSLGSGSLITYAPVALTRLLRRFRPDLVHVEEEPWSFAALELSCICRALAIPVTLFTWENTDRRLLLPFRLIRSWTMCQARAVVAGNDAAKMLVQRHGFARAVTVLPQLGVDPSAFYPDSGAVDLRPVVGYVGRLVPQKGILVLLEALALLSSNVRLMVVGNGPLSDEIVRRARALALDGRLELHQGVAHHEVPAFLRRMSVLVLPSLTTPTWREQFGHVLIEAMACGVPVVGSDSGAIPEVISDAGVVVPEGDPRALAAALERLIASPPLRAAYTSRGRARVLAQYTNEAVAHRLAAFWEAVAKTRVR